MSDRLVLVSLVALLLAAGLSAPLCAEADEPPAWEAYQVIVERNIFLRDRSRQVELDVPPMELPPLEAAFVPPEARLVLTGITRREGRDIAFVEDTERGTTVRLAAGDWIAGGRIAEVALEGIVYERGDRSLVVRVGHALDGSVYSPRVEPQQASPALMPPLTSASEPARQRPPRRADRAVAEAPEREAAPPAGDDDPDVQAILERLRERRLEEMTR